MPSVLDTARRYVAAGLSVIPIRGDGSKRPALGSWKQYQSRLPTDDELRRWFVEETTGLAVVCGKVSGGLEVLDFDAADAFASWSHAIHVVAPGKLERLPR